MKKVIIESPYKPVFEQTGDKEKDALMYQKIKDENITYARLCLLHSLNKKESPIASHLLLTQVLDDRIPEQREQGIAAGLSWYFDADIIAFYIDKGYSEGMLKAKKKAIDCGLRWEERSILK